MSEQQQEPSKAIPPEVAANSKVIVLSMKQFPTLKLDSLTNLEPSNSFTLRQYQPLQMKPSPSITNPQQPQKALQLTTPASSSSTNQYVLRQAQPLPAGAVTISASKQSQFAPLINCPNVKIQDVAKTLGNETVMTTQAGHKIVLQQSGMRNVTITSASAHQAAKPNEILPHVGKIIISKSNMLPVTAQQKASTATIVQKNLVPIRPKIQESRQLVMQIPALTQHSKTVSSNNPSFTKFTQKWSLSLPALTPIKPQPAITAMAPTEATEKPCPDLSEVKRIIEGDTEIVEPPDVYNEINDDRTFEEDQHSKECKELSDTSSLLCDEKIETVSPAISEKEKIETEDGITPRKPSDEDAEVQKMESMANVKRNLSEELTHLQHSEIDQEMNSSHPKEVIAAKNAMDYDEYLSKCEISKCSSKICEEKFEVELMTENVRPKSKRARKPKNPTVFEALGLPYKPSQQIQRKSKIDKKLEFELDYHDPLNKIYWDDGIGAMNNCNKLFGFNEFGLIEVLDKKDMMAKMKKFKMGTKKVKDEIGEHKLRKIMDPEDQYVCVVCAKFGTIRDFYSPECCSESCMAIMKRKATETGNATQKESSPESCQSLAPVCDENKMTYGGEMISVKELQKHIMQQHLPTDNKQHKRRQSNPTIADAIFQWDTYLTPKSVPAPISLFKNPYPRNPNPFKAGMKLEAIDPENQSIFCVCTVAEKLGYRIKLHIDGYSTDYDFWVNADSTSIFYAGFCKETNRILQPPPKLINKKFDWSIYMDDTNSIGAQKSLFMHLNRACNENPFEQNMKLEVTDKKRSGKICVGTIIDIIGNRMLISFDGRDKSNCIWMEITSPYLHPCNYHKTVVGNDVFLPPKGYESNFSWQDYLEETKCKEAPAKFLFFRTRQPYDFEPGLKLEIVDRINPQLIRPATILCRNEYEVQVVFDGFDISYAYWVADDSDDIHPINWCHKTGHPIEHPAGFRSKSSSLCSTSGCRGIGNGLFSDRYFHDNIEECPYSKTNWQKILVQRKKLRVDLQNLGSNNFRSSSMHQIVTTVDTIKQEVHDVAENSMHNIETDMNSSSEVKQAPKKRGRKRKIPQIPLEQTLLTKSLSQHMNPSVEQNVRIKASKTFLTDYGPQLNYSYALWKKHSKVLDEATVHDEQMKNPMQWTVAEVSSFIKKIPNCDEGGVVSKVFVDQEIDGEAFLSLSQDDLIMLLNIKIGIAIKIYNRILHLRETMALKFFEI